MPAKTWLNADAVCFDVDCTITKADSLDAFAHFMGKGAACAKLTTRAMEGTMELFDSLQHRLDLLKDATPDDIKAFHDVHPAEARLAPNIVQLIRTLHEYGVHVYLISGGFQELIFPLADHLGISRDNVFANRMLWKMSSEIDTAEMQLHGLDDKIACAHNMGKINVIQHIRKRSNHKTIVMVGDGITDLETVQSDASSRGADFFVGYGGVVERKSVKEAVECDWYVNDFSVLTEATAARKLKVAMIGSGAWACAVTSIISANLREESNHVFDPILNMWVYEEEVDGRPLTDIINETHENPKYLPGICIGHNVVATPCLKAAISNADVLIFCAPHQFVSSICDQINGLNCLSSTARAISLVKGLNITPDGAQLISQLIAQKLGVNCSVLMGANIASDIAQKEFGESVIAYDDHTNALMFKKLIQRDHFNISLLPDVAGAELCGTLKNIVALAAGMVDGLGLGNNTKAVVIRRGLEEMKRFSKKLYPNVQDDTFLETCGVADLITTCYGGRNRRVAMEYTQAVRDGIDTSFTELEARLLDGQKLQGVLTSNEVQELLFRRGWEADFPLFTQINRIVNGCEDPNVLIKTL